MRRSNSANDSLLWLLRLIEINTFRPSPSAAARELDADFFFAHPYASWERGANENMNGLIRQFFPKKMRFYSITGKDIAFAMHRLNHRPRKRLGFKTPHEVFMKQLHSRHNAVALQT